MVHVFAAFLFVSGILIAGGDEATITQLSACNHLRSTHTWTDDT